MADLPRKTQVRKDAINSKYNSDRSPSPGTSVITAASPNSTSPIRVAFPDFSLNARWPSVDADAGQVIEEGTHEELLEQEGAYSQLMSTQVRSFSTIGD